MTHSRPLIELRSGMCQLCGLHPAIENSHIIPAFVYRAIKRDSPTKYFRNMRAPNVRLQDGHKTALLCRDCEGRFSAAERAAAAVFEAFHNRGQCTFEYGDWMQYFLTSLAWRTLCLDLPGIAEDGSASTKILNRLQHTMAQASLYLLGDHQLASCFRNHIVFVGEVTSCSANIASLGPNVMFRRSAFGYVLLNNTSHVAAVVNNLAGMICVLLIVGHPRDRWENTKIAPCGGRILEPQHVSSWIMGDLVEVLTEAKGLSLAQLSQAQTDKIVTSALQNPEARALRCHAADDALRESHELR